MATISNTDSTHRDIDDSNKCHYNSLRQLKRQVDACFHRIAGHLAGIALSRPQLDAAGGVVAANIVNHKRHDEKVNGGEVPDYVARRPKTCTVS